MGNRQSFKSGFRADSLSQVGAWYRNNTVGDINTIENLLDGTNSLTSTTDPVGNANLTITLVDDFFSWPITSVLNSQTHFSFYTWIKPANVSGTKGLFCQRAVAGGTNLHRLLFQITGAGMLVDVSIDNSNTRRGRETTSLAAGVSSFVGFEFNGTRTGDERLIITENKIPLSLTYTDSAGTPGVMPETLVSVTGSTILFAVSTVPGSPFVGDAGINGYVINGLFEGATEGNLTDSARQALMDLDPLL